MIGFLSSWAEQIILAVIIATIIELILPNNKSKKYIQMVIGVYILFNIISPIIDNKEEFSIDKYKVQDSTASSNYEVDQTSMDKRLEKIYLEELEKNVKTKFEEKGFTVSKCTIDAVLDSSKKNAGIHMITVKLKGSTDSQEAENARLELANEYEIDQNKIKIIIT